MNSDRTADAVQADRRVVPEPVPAGNQEGVDPAFVVPAPGRWRLPAGESEAAIERGYLRAAVDGDGKLLALRHEIEAEAERAPKPARGSVAETWYAHFLAAIDRHLARAVRP